MIECPKCHYDMYPIYDEVNSGEKSKYMKFTNYHSVFSLDSFNAHEWDIECKCPKCKTEWVELDGDH